MADFSTITSDSRCFNCLSRTVEKQLQIYTIQQASLKTILQTEQLVLCYICNNVAKNAEQFIHNVQTTQNLFKNQVTDESLIYLMRPTLNLTVSSIQHTTISMECEKKYKVEYEVGLQHLTDPGSETSHINIKQERSENTIEEMSDDETLLNFDQLNEYAMKEESLLKLALLKNDAKPKTLTARTKNRKKGIRKLTIQSNEVIREGKVALGEIESKIEICNLTIEQCQEEREKKRLDKTYLGAEFKCTDCIRGFVYKPAFDKHMEKHGMVYGKYECDICKLRAPSEDQLRAHRRYHTVRYKCKVCHLTRSCRLNIEDHVATVHFGGVQYKCPICDKKFKGINSIKVHLTNTHQGKIQCMFCNKQFASKQSIKQHVRRCHAAEESATRPALRYTCEECGKKVASPSALKIHSAKHATTRDFYCVECNKSFQSYRRLQEHLKTVSVHAPLDAKHPCPICNKVFRTKTHANRHLNDIHIKALRYYCDQCGKEYRSKYKLADHVRAHAGIQKPREFICSYCQKGFYSQRFLDMHIRTHTGEKPFRCAQCPAQFAQSGSLYNHKRLVHDKRPRRKPSGKTGARAQPLVDTLN